MRREFRRAAGGDLAESPAVFERFVREFGDRAFNFAYRLCGSPEEAKDLTQEAFYRLLKSWDRYDPSQALDVWFLKIMKNIFYDHCKSYEGRNVVSLDAKPDEEDEDSTYGDLLLREDGRILEQLERKEAVGMVREALAAVSPEHRAILTLCDMEGLSYEEISRVIDAPVNTVRSRVSRAREALRRAFAAGTEVKG